MFLSLKKHVEGQSLSVSYTETAQEALTDQRGSQCL